MTRRRLRNAARTHSRSTITVFVIIGAIAASATAALTVGLLTGVVPPSALAGVVPPSALAAWVYAVWRLIDLAHRPDPLSLDCLDGRHLACLICGCTCHQDER